VKEAKTTGGPIALDNVFAPVPLTRDVYFPIMYFLVSAH
jgi:hypothetical protein